MPGGYSHIFPYRDVLTLNGNTWSSLEQSKTLQHFLLDRVAKFASLYLEEVRALLSQLNPPPYPTQIPVEYPRPLPPSPMLGCNEQLLFSDSGKGY